MNNFIHRLDVVLFESNKLNNIIHKIYRDTFDTEWSGLLYKVGSGIYYHTDPEGAEFYVDKSATGRSEVKTYKPFNANNVLIVGLDIVDGKLPVVGGDFIEELIGKNSGDIGIDIEEAIPKIRELGFDAVIIAGETGDVPGVPVEVIDLRG